MTDPLSTPAEVGPFKSIKSVNWGGGVFVLVYLEANTFSSQCVASATITPMLSGSKTVFEKKQDLIFTGGFSVYRAVALLRLPTLSKDDLENAFSVTLTFSDPEDLTDEFVFFTELSLIPLGLHALFPGDDLYPFRHIPPRPDPTDCFVYDTQIYVKSGSSYRELSPGSYFFVVRKRKLKTSEEDATKVFQCWSTGATYSSVFSYRLKDDGSATQSYPPEWFTPFSGPPPKIA